MRHFLICTLILATYLPNAFSQARLSIDVKELDRKIFALVPQNGKFILHNKHQLDPKNRKSFSLKLKGERTGFIYIFYKFKLFPIFLKSGMRTKVSFSPLKEIKFSGDFQKENAWFNQWEKRFVSPYSSSNPSLTDTIFKIDPDKAFFVWKSMLNESLQDLDMSCVSCDEEFKNMASSDMIYFYANEFIRSILRHTSSAVIWEKTENFTGEDMQSYQAFTSSWAPAWDSINNYVSIDQEALFSQDYLAFLRAYYDIYRLGYRKEYADQYNDLQSREELIIKLAKQELSRPVYEALYAFNLEYILGAGPQVFSPDFITRYERFKSEFPASGYLLSLEKSMQPVYDFVNKSDKPITENTFLPTDQFSNLNSLIEAFKGDVVLVDLWATWCKPCLEEFENSKALHAYTKGKKISLLYVSIDKPEKKEKWKEFIAKYNLIGSHILASEDLISDIWDQVGDVGTTGIPRYIIFDKNGDLIEKNANRPSDGKKLFNQLEVY
jgi:thiol-disulfide isomerase/thioredoxin